MTENDQYPQRDPSKRPVLTMLAVLLAFGIAAIVYETSDHSPPAGSGVPVTTGTNPNPNALVPQGAGRQSPTPP